MQDMRNMRNMQNTQNMKNAKGAHGDLVTPAQPETTAAPAVAAKVSATTKKTVVLATNNAHKASEIKAALSFPGWEFKTLREFGIHSDPEENASTFEGNARIKAAAAQRAAAQTVGHALAALADDSGLMVDALDGAPGVHSARYASLDGKDADDDANNAKLLSALENTPDEKRTARFVSSIVFIDEDGTELSAAGTVEGRIGRTPQGEEGFGYDPLFWPDAFKGECTMAEVPQDRKNEVSHRGNALRALRSKLESLAGSTGSN